jgi:TonB-dependent SusC/RagA subfamily outer membrane receptor
MSAPTRLLNRAALPGTMLACWLAVACAAAPAGTGTRSAGGVSGASGHILTRAQIEKIHATGMEELFEGRFTGVHLARRGGDITLRIRGNGEPLLVLDGVPASSVSLLWGLNPADIEQIEILKDAQTSYYGLRGANGVVVVTTRIR